MFICWGSHACHRLICGPMWLFFPPEWLMSLELLISCSRPQGYRWILTGHAYILISSNKNWTHYKFGKVFLWPFLLLSFHENCTLAPPLNANKKFAIHTSPTVVHFPKNHPHPPSWQHLCHQPSITRSHSTVSFLKQEHSYYKVIHFSHKLMFTRKIWYFFFILQKSSFP